jgi:peptidoglycan hydrolase CwlO-like protein
MKKLALLCVSVMLIGAVPAFAADPNNTSIQQLQSKNPQVYQEIMNIKNHIIANFDKIKALMTQNKILKNKIQNIRNTNSSTMQQDISTLKTQIQNNRAEIKSIHTQNKDLRKEIQNILHIQNA